MTADVACVVCGEGKLHLEESERTTEIDGVAYTVPFCTHWCAACGTKQGLNEDLRFNARAMRQLRKKHCGLLTGEEVRACRKKLGLNQDQAAKLFGGGPVAFSKYENDEIAQSDAMDTLIWIVAMNPGLMIALAERRNISLPASAIVVLEKMQVNVSEEYFLNASASVEYTNHALEGFSNVPMFQASNEHIFHYGPEIRAVEWEAA